MALSANLEVSGGRRHKYVLPLCVSAPVVAAIADLRPPQLTTAATGLSLCINADQRTARRRFRAEIAHEAINRPDLHVTGRATSAIDQSRGNQRFFYKTPALRMRVRTSAFFGNGSCAAQLRIDF